MGDEGSSKPADATVSPQGQAVPMSTASADHASRRTQFQPQHGADQSSMNMRSMGQALPDTNNNNPALFQGTQQNIYVQQQYPPNMQQYSGNPYQQQQTQQQQWNSGYRSPQSGYYQQMPGGPPTYAFQQAIPMQQNIGRSGYPQGPFMGSPQMSGQFYHPSQGGFFPQAGSPQLQGDIRRQSFGMPGAQRRHDSSSSGRDMSGYQSGSQANSSSLPLPSTLRGPPRKPKQSGHALWVGNLPPSTTVLELKDYFATNLTDAIQSVFWIPKSNCAFVNYRSASSCAAAMAAFHDSTFQGLRLVCRLRQTPQSQASSSLTVPTPRTETEASSASGESAVESVDGDESTTSKSEATPKKADLKARDRYFIVKSLTVEDLELSVRNGLWATQSHNEESLNKAYKNSEAVYLIFSANKSGEYFGYARMVSEISEVPASEVRTDSPESSNTDLPKSIQTTATDTAPPGRVIDDWSRGTIFWEIVETDDEDDAEPASRKSPAEDKLSNVSAWTKAFRVEWVSTDRVPFFRVRGMRNPWNSNREVKIARDGTELEPSVGRALVAVFHQPIMPSGMMHPDMSGMMGVSASGAMHANLYPTTSG